MVPSSVPSGSIYPSAIPSSKPSTSLDPSALPSFTPSSSSKPSFSPSSEPSMSPFYICLYETLKNQANSQDYAQQNGGNLVSIHCDEQNNQIYSQFGGNKFWIGVNDLASEGTFVNNDGTPFDYDNWKDGEPNNINGEDCVITGDNWGKEWIDTGCGGLTNRYFGMLLVPDPIGGLTCVEYVGK
jgi:hypothetical protein